MSQYMDKCKIFCSKQTQLRVLKHTEKHDLGVVLGVVFHANTR